MPNFFNKVFLIFNLSEEESFLLEKLLTDSKFNQNQFCLENLWTRKKLLYALKKLREKNLVFFENNKIKNLNVIHTKILIKELKRKHIINQKSIEAFEKEINKKKFNESIIHDTTFIQSKDNIINLYLDLLENDSFKTDEILNFGDLESFLKYFDPNLVSFWVQKRENLGIKIKTINCNNKLKIKDTKFRKVKNSSFQLPNQIISIHRQKALFWDFSSESVQIINFINQVNNYKNQFNLLWNI
jgi:hypothetical protein